MSNIPEYSVSELSYLIKKKLEQVINNGIFNNIKSNAYVIDHTTVSPETAKFCFNKFKYS